MRVKRTSAVITAAPKTQIINLIGEDLPLMNDQGLLVTYPAKVNPAYVKTEELDATGVQDAESLGRNGARTC